MPRFCRVFQLWLHGSFKRFGRGDAVGDSLALDLGEAFCLTFLFLHHLEVVIVSAGASLSTVFTQY